MKNPICRIAAALMICTVLFAGCASFGNSLPKELAGQDYSNLDTFNLLTPYFFMDQAENTAAIKQQWLDEMTSRYGVKLNIVSDSYIDGKRTNDAINQTWNTLYGKASFGGMVYTYNYDLLTKAIQNGTAVPLEDYLADNQAWNALPDEYKNAYKIDGHIYAIPTSLDWNMNARSIHTDTLEQTGINVTDLSSFKEYALAVKKAGKYQSVLGSTDADSLGDILNAYGLYSIKYSGHPFSYDPTEDCFVDFLTKDSAITALEYLRSLYAEGVLKLYNDNSSDPYNDFTDGKCATYYDEFMMYEKYTEILTLNPPYPQLLDCTMTGYIMTKDTPQPKETVNFFVNMVFGSEQNYLDCYLGLSENYVLNSDGSTTLKLNVAEDGSINNFPSPNLVGTLPGIFPHSSKNFKLEIDGTLSPEMADAMERSTEYLAAIDNAVKQGSAVKVPITYRQIHSLKFYEDKTDINYLYVNCIKDAITAENWTVQEIVEQYRADMLNMGGNALLDEMNAAIGKQTAYYYN